jgi:transcription-repair coupling factor (superfamily II helicase)
MLKIKFFKKIEKVFDYISEKTVIFIQNNGLQLDKQFAKAEEAFEKLSKDITRYARAIILNQASFIKKSSRLFGC